jgi:signal transduction histidine kinase
MKGQAKRILVALAVGAAVALVSVGIAAALIRSGMSSQAAIFSGVLLGVLAATCTYLLSLSSLERRTEDEAAERLRGEGAHEERLRLTREIHDTVAQGFAGIVANLEAAEEFLEDRPEARKLCGRALAIGRASLTESRYLLQGLRTPALENEGLKAAVTRMIERISVEGGLRSACSIEDLPAQFSSDHEVNLFRIIQEGVTNIWKHANASEMRVTLRVKQNQIQLCIEDDGRGFSPVEPSMRPGFGLTTMRERATNLGGLLWVYTQPAKGTQINVVMPLPLKSQTRIRSCQTQVAYESSSPMITASSVKA